MNKRKQRGFISFTQTELWIFIAAGTLFGWAFWSFVFWLFSFVHISIG